MKPMSFIRSSSIRQICLKGIVGVLFLLLACEAERDNPRDPDSPYYTGEGTIVGWVKTRIGEPIPGMRLVAETEDTSYIYSFSDEEGFYKLADVKAGSTQVIASQQGYASDSAWVELRVEETDTVNFILDILPWFVSCRGITSHVPYGDSKYSAEFQAEVKDGDGLVDIDSVFLWIDELPDTFYLEYDAGVYHKTVEADVLPDSSLESLIGKDCFFVVQDKAGQKVQSTPVRIARIIHEEPAVVRPVNFETVGKNPELIWRKPHLSYLYTFTVEVMKLPNKLSEIRIWGKDGIPAVETTVTVPFDLSSADYCWVVWVVDEFGDKSRSGLATFRVK